MKRIILPLLLLLGVSVYGADSKVTALTQDTSPALTDILYEVKDPGGSPLSRKVTIDSILFAGSTYYTTSGLSLSSATATYLQISSATANFVPFTGGTQDVSMGSARSITAGHLYSGNTASTYMGYANSYIQAYGGTNTQNPQLSLAPASIQLTYQTAPPVTGNGGDIELTAGNGGATSGNGGNIVFAAGSKTSGTAGDYVFYDPTKSYLSHMDYSKITADRRFYLPNSSGTIALTSDIVGGASSLSINQSGVQISSPTSQINFVGSGVSVTLGGSSTATVTINGGGSSIYPATSTVVFPYGVSISSFVIMNTDLISANQTLTSTHTIVFASATAAGLSLTLPSDSGTNGRYLEIKSVGTSTGTVTVLPPSAHLIDRQSTFTINPLGGYTFIAYGNQWWVK